jgi:SAM-dependent methyltransferase
MIDLYDPANRTQRLSPQGDWLVSPDGTRYPVKHGIPRFSKSTDKGQDQTSDSFGYKWTKQSSWGIESQTRGLMDDTWRDFFGWESLDELRTLVSGKVVLDAGCGSGAALNRFIEWPKWIVGADISSAVDACRENFQGAQNLQLVQADISQLPFADEVFDVVWSAGVLHHTPDTFHSLTSICRHLKVGGSVIFYVYIKKAPIREFVDDYLRDRVSDLPHDEAWESMERWTRFSKALSETDAEITLADDYPELGFSKGTYNLQRFIYYNIMKCFWNPTISFEHNVNVNFDWYHPKYSHRHTPDEVDGWLESIGLHKTYSHISASGITVIAEKLVR